MLRDWVIKSAYMYMTVTGSLCSLKYTSLLYYAAAVLVYFIRMGVVTRNMSIKVRSYLVHVTDCNCNNRTDTSMLRYCFTVYRMCIQFCSWC